ncbi:ABC transporter permease [Kribbella qitaiheensis]|uniref:ABC transporter permease n=1 Tax=Kribbella qitaiheensis TaxID=1544730 RepID=A0A7G6X527_9ACTN|nr:ABC transporter permease [Kribbella qitaiheensis]QNE21342.1 ABC transporter permease [Kribbella qitaiheensis]
MARSTSNSVTTIGRRAGNSAIELAVPVLTVAVWWVASSGSTSLYFPPLSEIVATLWDVWFGSNFVSDAVPSLWHLGVGYGLAVVAGISLGVVLGLIPPLAAAMNPLLETLRAVPGLALIPAALLVLGIGPTMQVVTIASAAVWPILLNTVDGVRGIDPLVGDAARSYRIGWTDRTFRLIIPAASPQIVAGLRTSVSVAVVMVVVSEMVGATHGIGYQLLHAQRSFDITGMWASMVLLGVLGYVLNVAFRGFERVVLGWHRGMTGTQG